MNPVTYNCRKVRVKNPVVPEARRPSTVQESNLYGTPPLHGEETSHTFTSVLTGPRRRHQESPTRAPRVPRTRIFRTRGVTPDLHV